MNLAHRELTDVVIGIRRFVRNNTGILMRTSHSLLHN